MVQSSCFVGARAFESGDSQCYQQRSLLASRSRSSLSRLWVCAYVWCFNAYWVVCQSAFWSFGLYRYIRLVPTMMCIDLCKVAFKPCTGWICFNMRICPHSSVYWGDMLLVLKGSSRVGQSERMSYHCWLCWTCLQMRGVRILPVHNFFLYRRMSYGSRHC